MWSQPMLVITLHVEITRVGAVQPTAHAGLDHRDVACSSGTTAMQGPLPIRRTKLNGFESSSIMRYEVDHFLFGD